MSGISPIVFNGSNAYELSLNDYATSWPQGALGIEQVSAGVQLRSPTAGAGAILRIRAIGTNGLLISELSQTHILTVLNNWERAEKTYTLPAGTVKLELRIVAVGGAVLFAQPKLANGTSVGAYATNFAPQLTMITPTGLYTGTITAEQIILTGGERLPDRLLSLNASLISLRSGIDGTDQKIAELKAESLTFTDTMTGKTSKLTADGLYTDKVSANQVKTGLLSSTNNNSWINLDNGRFSFGNGALAWDGTSLSARGNFETIGGTQSAKMDGGSLRLLNNGVDMGYFSVQAGAGVTGPWVTAAQAASAINFAKLVNGNLNSAYVIDWGSSGSSVAKHKFTGDTTLNGNATFNGKTTLNGDVSTAYSIEAGIFKTNNIFDSANKSRIQMVPGGGMYFRDHVEIVRFWADDAQTLMQGRYASHGAFGLDSGGPFYIKSGAKKYFT